MVIKSNYFQFSVIWTYLHYPKTYLPIGSNWLFFSYLYFTGRLHPVTAIHEILQLIAIFLRIFDSNRFEYAKSCNILQYFKDGWNRLQPYTKYCNIFQLFLPTRIRIDSNPQNVAISSNISYMAATGCNRPWNIAIYCNILLIRIDSNRKLPKILQ